MIYNSIIETIGNTPMIRLNKLAKDIQGEVLVKVEYFNPGNSMKDRMAIKMVEDAEKAGLLKPCNNIRQAFIKAESLKSNLFILLRSNHEYLT